MTIDNEKELTAGATTTTTRTTTTTTSTTTTTTTPTILLTTTANKTFQRVGVWFGVVVSACVRVVFSSVFRVVMDGDGRMGLSD